MPRGLLACLLILQVGLTASNTPLPPAPCQAPRLLCGEPRGSAAPPLALLDPCLHPCLLHFLRGGGAKRGRQKLVGEDEAAGVQAAGAEHGGRRGRMGAKRARTTASVSEGVMSGPPDPVDISNGAGGREKGSADGGARRASGGSGEQGGGEAKFLGVKAEKSGLYVVRSVNAVIGRYATSRAAAMAFDFFTISRYFRAAEERVAAGEEKAQRRPRVNFPDSWQAWERERAAGHDEPIVRVPELCGVVAPAGKHPRPEISRPRRGREDSVETCARSDGARAGEHLSAETSTVGGNGAAEAVSIGRGLGNAEDRERAWREALVRTKEKAREAAFGERLRLLRAAQLQRAAKQACPGYEAAGDLLLQDGCGWSSLAPHKTADPAGGRKHRVLDRGTRRLQATPLGTPSMAIGTPSAQPPPAEADSNTSARPLEGLSRACPRGRAGARQEGAGCDLGTADWGEVLREAFVAVPQEVDLDVNASPSLRRAAGIYVCAYRWMDGWMDGWMDDVWILRTQSMRRCIHTHAHIHIFKGRRRRGRSIGI